MKAILLAGGKGTRLRPLTIHTPKPIVPIFNRPFLHYQIDLLKQVPEIVVRGLETGDAVRGIGEPPVPPAAPALANAIFAATGTRVRELPMRKTVRFV